jgi:hypothetical protein
MYSKSAAVATKVIPKRHEPTGNFLEIPPVSRNLTHGVSNLKGTWMPEVGPGVPTEPEADHLDAPFLTNGNRAGTTVGPGGPPGPTSGDT